MVDEKKKNPKKDLTKSPRTKLLQDLIAKGVSPGERGAILDKEYPFPDIAPGGSFRDPYDPSVIRGTSKGTGKYADPSYVGPNRLGSGSKEYFEQQEQIKKEQQLTPQQLQQQEQQSPLQQQAQQEEKGGVQKVAEMGVTPAVVGANLISKGLKAAGIADIGTITSEQFASTGVGKFLGVATAIAGLTLAAASIGSFAATILPSGAGLGEAGALTGIQGIRTATSAAVAKTSVISKLASSKLIKTIFVAGIIKSGIDGRISDLESSVVNQRESLTLISAAVDAGAISREEGFLMFDEIEQSMNESDSAIQKASIVSIKSWLGKGKEVQTRLEKARIQLLVERAKLQNQNI